MGEALLSSRKGSGNGRSGSESIGDIKYTCRTDLGDNWVPCDGRYVYGDEICNVLKRGLKTISTGASSSGAAYMGYSDGNFYFPYTNYSDATGIYITSDPKNPDSWEYIDLADDLLDGNLLGGIVSISFLNNKFILLVKPYNPYGRVGYFNIYESESIKGPYTKKGIIGSTSSNTAYNYHDLNTNTNIIYKDPYYYIMLVMNSNTSTGKGCLYLWRSEDLASWNYYQVYISMSASSTGLDHTTSVFTYSEALKKFIIAVGRNGNANNTVSYYTATDAFGTWTSATSIGYATDRVIDIRDVNGRCVIFTDLGATDTTYKQLLNFGGVPFRLNDGLYVKPTDKNKKICKINEDNTIEELELEDYGAISLNSSTYGNLSLGHTGLGCTGASDGNNIFVIFNNSASTAAYYSFDSNARIVPTIPSIDTEQAYIKVE